MYMRVIIKTCKHVPIVKAHAHALSSAQIWQDQR